MEKWIEKDVQLITRDGQGGRTVTYHTWDVVILKFVAGFVPEVKSNFSSWHFLRESPYLCLRFYGEDGSIDQLSNKLDNQLNSWDINNQHIIIRHFYGCKQVENEQYVDEIGRFGKGWPIMAHYLQNGSETALEYLNHVSNLGKGCADDNKRMLELFEHLLPGQFDYRDYIKDSDREQNFWPIMERWIEKKLEIEGELTRLKENIDDTVERHRVYEELKKGFSHLFLGTQLGMNGH